MHVESRSIQSEVDVEYRFIAKELVESTKSQRDFIVNEYASNKLAHLLSVTNGALEGKTVLELGCGAIRGEPMGGGEYYEPWLCRILHELGVAVTGIDVVPSVLEEPFVAYAQNLLSDTSLDMLEDNSIDVACAFGLLTSPMLLRDLLYTNMSALDFEVDVIRRLERVVKPEGTFVYFNNW